MGQGADLPGQPVGGLEQRLTCGGLEQRRLAAGQAQCVGQVRLKFLAPEAGEVVADHDALGERFVMRRRNSLWPTSSRHRRRLESRPEFVSRRSSSSSSWRRISRRIAWQSGAWRRGGRRRRRVLYFTLFRQNSSDYSDARPRNFVD